MKCASNCALLASDQLWERAQPPPVPGGHGAPRWLWLGWGHGQPALQGEGREILGEKGRKNLQWLGKGWVRATVSGRD